MKKATLLWVDLEMTGLDPEKDRILEVAAIATDWNLVTLESYTAVAKVSSELLKTRMIGDFWEKNAVSRDALIAQNETGKSIKHIETELLDFVKLNFKVQSIEIDPRSENKIILAGNSIHQDRKFIDREMPEFAKKLHYRMLDVSAWKLYFEGAKKQRFMKRETHRALDDIEGSIEELKWYLSFLKGNEDE